MTINVLDHQHHDQKIRKRQTKDIASRSKAQSRSVLKIRLSWFIVLALLILLLNILLHIFVRLIEKDTLIVVTHNQSQPLKLKSTQGDQSTNHAAAPWRESDVLPPWMKAYFEWHQNVVGNLTSDNWHQNDYLVVRCLEVDDKCGGTADRLKPLPFLLIAAAKLRRLIFFKWEKPAALEEFLLPPNQGLDWRWPPHPALANYTLSETPEIASNYDLFSRIGYFGLDDDGNPTKIRRNDAPPPPLPTIASIRPLLGGHGINQYNSLRNNNETERSYDEVFRDCWYSVFVPSPPVQELIDQSMKDLDLQKDQYHGIHIRALYHSMTGPGRNRYQAQNSVNCLVNFLHKSMRSITADTRIFVSSDLRFSSRSAVQYARKQGLKNAVSRVPLDIADESEERDEPILHLDRGRSFVAKKTFKWTRHEAMMYYDTFVDLYLLSYSKCIAFNVGNYGKWANLLSSDHSCQFNHMKNICSWPEITKLSNQPAAFLY
ncbi:hypothetical protein ACA910_014262 [Epithemia clementina (nom. ined.)]